MNLTYKPKMKWGWATPKGVQDEVFDSATDAIEAMRKRVGDPEMGVETAYEMLSARLVLLKVALEPVMVLDKV